MSGPPAVSASDPGVTALSSFTPRPQELEIPQWLYQFTSMDTKGGRGEGGGMNWEIGIDIYMLICIK